MCVDEKVIYLQIEVFVSWSYQIFKRMLPFFPSLGNPEIVKVKRFCCIFDAGTRFLSTVFHISVYKKFCLLFTMRLVLHFEVNKRICIAW